MAVAITREVERQIEQRRRLGVHASAGSTLASPLLSKGPGENSFFRWVQDSTSISDAQERKKLRRSLFLKWFGLYQPQRRNLVCNYQVFAWH